MQELNDAIRSVYLSSVRRKIGGRVDLSFVHEDAVAETMGLVIGALLRVRGIRSRRVLKCPPAILQVELQRVEQVLGSSASAKSASLVGAALEELRGLQPLVDRDGDVSIATSAEQRSRGVYFTPAELADEVVRGGLKEALRATRSTSELRSIRILDPAVGCGSFLLAAVRVGAEILAARPGFASMSRADIKREFIEHCVYGTDIDPIAVATTKALLVAELGAEDWDASILDQRIRVFDAIASSPSDWSNEFGGGGFGCIFTNPPWGKLRPLRAEFFEHVDKQVRLLQGSALEAYLARDDIAALRASWKSFMQRTLDMSRALKSSGHYPGSAGGGDADLYKYFVERCLSLLAPNGVAALLLPSGFLRAQGAAPLRRMLLSQGTVLRITEYINKGKIFDIHSMYRFTSIVYQHRSSDRPIEARFAVQDIGGDATRKSVKLDSRFLASVSGIDSMIPEVRTSTEKELLERLYATPRNHTFGRVSFRREFDMTNDSTHFIPFEDAIARRFQPGKDGRWRSPRRKDALLPVFEGRMVHQYDCCAKEYRRGQGRSARWETPVPGKGGVVPHYFVTEKLAVERGWRPVRRVGYCEISGHANERTVLAAVIPGFAVCGNKVPVLILPFEEGIHWLAFANSLVIDWVMRRWVSTTVNHFYWRNVPFASITDSRRDTLLKSAANALSRRPGRNVAPELWLARRAKLRATIDAVIMEAYGITDADVDLIMQDFPAFARGSSRYSDASVGVHELLHAYRWAIGKNSSFDLKDIDRVIDSKACVGPYATRDQISSLVGVSQ